MKIKNVKEFEEFKRNVAKRKKDIVISVSSGTCGLAKGAEEVFEALKKEIEINGLEKKIEIKATGCHGFCQYEPTVVIKKNDLEVILINVNEKDSKKIIESALRRKKSYTPKEIKEFVLKQKRILLENNKYVDPKNIEDYIAIGGYTSLSKALNMEGKEIVEIVKKSGLRGRGGAGFPTGKKWDMCRNQKSDKKYIICNADEGDPGAYMNRALLEGNPHLIIEGMIIGAYAIGADEGIIYVRSEYPLAVKNLEIAIKQAEEYGFLGENILSSGFNFKLKIFEGAGAFVCGEETALISSIEGFAGEPRLRPPYPAEKGLYGKPTNINNVETWANVPFIIAYGWKWFSSIGTGKSKGTKIFSLVGKVKNTGLVEVPFGTTLREVIYEIGGGIKDGKFKAVQIGGPSGGCIPEKSLDKKLDYEEISESGAIMGSGGLIVMDEKTCVVDVAKYFTNFLRYESCGKCNSCREGLNQMYAILDRITKGKGKLEDLTLLEELGEYIKKASLCGLGKTAPNPVLTTLKYFKNEYLAHIKEKKCPAGVCKELIEYSIEKEKCVGCGKCNEVCSTGAIDLENYKIEKEKCIKCGACYEVCKKGAITIK